jgi:hypothetical protein
MKDFTLLFNFTLTYLTIDASRGLFLGTDIINPKLLPTNPEVVDRAGENHCSCLTARYQGPMSQWR